MTIEPLSVNVKVCYKKYLGDMDKNIMNRLQEKYSLEVKAKLKTQFGYSSSMQIPKLEKIVVSICSGKEAVKNPKTVPFIESDLALMTGQKPCIARAKKAIANFKLRKGMALGAFVTLRREKMWCFLDRLISLALPRVRDFRGISPHGFDGRGNFNMGLKEQIVFPEINYDKIDQIRGMNITICTSATSNKEGLILLGDLGMPFRKT